MDLDCCIASGLIDGCGCENKEYSLADGRYMLRLLDGEASVPYVLINGDHFTIVNDLAVSYQPSGEIVIKGNHVSMEADYGGATCRWSFALTGDNQLTFLLDWSKVPEGSGWKRGMVFCLAEE